MSQRSTQTCNLLQERQKRHRGCKTHVQTHREEKDRVARTHRKDLTSRPRFRIWSIMYSQLPGLARERPPAPPPLQREAPAPAGLPRAPRGAPRVPPPSPLLLPASPFPAPPPSPGWPDAVFNSPKLWDVVGGWLRPGPGGRMRGCWRLCCRRSDRGRAGPDEMCSRVDA